jgi:hypothetical protein
MPKRENKDFSEGRPTLDMGHGGMMGYGRGGIYDVNDGMSNIRTDFQQDEEYQQDD